MWVDDSGKYEAVIKKYPGRKRPYAVLVYRLGRFFSAAHCTSYPNAIKSLYSWENMNWRKTR